MIRALKWLMLFLAVLFVVGLVTAADSGRGREFFLWVGSFPAGDKLGHLVVFGFLAFLANAALDAARWRVGRLTLLKGSICVFIPTALEEFSQLFLITRTFDLLDLLADGIGIALGGWLAVVLLRRVGVSSSRINATSEPGAVAARDSP